MKDPARHLNKVNRKVVRSVKKSVKKDDEMPTPPPRNPTKTQAKKQAKAAKRKERKARAPVHLTEEERNRKMKHRVPVFDRINNAKPKSTKKTRKKTPRL